MPLIIGLDLPIAPRLSAEGPAAVQIRVVVYLQERLERHTQPLAVAEHAAVVIGNSPRTGIDVQVLVEPALLGKTAELGITVPAAQAPITAARTAVEFQYLHLVAGVAQLVGGAHPGDARAEYQHRRAGGRALQFDGTSIGGVGGKAETAHGLIHGGAPRSDADHAQQIAAARRRRGR